MCRGVFWFPKYQMLGISEKLQNTVVVGVGSGMMVVVLALARSASAEPKTKYNGLH